jgi:hypothetical protein
MELIKSEEVISIDRLEEDQYLYATHLFVLVIVLPLSSMLYCQNRRNRRNRWR